MSSMTTPTIPGWIWIGAAGQLASAIACFWITMKAIRERKRALDAHHAEMMKIAVDGVNKVHALTIEHLDRMEKQVADYIAAEDRRLTHLEAAVFGQNAPPPAAQSKVH